MFGFGDIIEKATALIGNGGALQETLGRNLGELLSNANLDPSLLENLPIDQVQTYLADAGIDTSALTEGQLGELIQNFTGNDSA